MADISVTVQLKNQLGTIVQSLNVILQDQLAPTAITAPIIH